MKDNIKVNPLKKKSIPKTFLGKYRKPKNSKRYTFKVSKHYSVNIFDYSSKDDILFINWSNKKNAVEHTEEIKLPCGRKACIDYDKKNRVVGIEIFDWGKIR